METSSFSTINTNRKCDRTLPGCMQCKLKGKECRYPEPMKRGPPKTALQMQPYPSSIDGSGIRASSGNGKLSTDDAINTGNNNTDDQPINFQIVDMYFDIISLGCPIIQRSVMMDIISKNPLMNSNAPEEVALMYAIQANCYQRLGRKIEGRTAFNTSRKYLSQVFDLLDNFAIAGTFMYLSSFCMGEAEFNQSRYYLSSVQFFVAQNKQRLKDNIHFIHLCKTFMYLQLLLEEEEALDILSEEMKNSEQALHTNVVTTEKLTLQVYHFKKMIDFFMFITQNISDGQCGSSSNLSPSVPPPQFSSTMEEQLIQNHIQMIYSIPSQFNRSRSEASGTIRQVTKLMYLLMIDGIRLGILTKSQTQSDDVLIETANRIADFTTISYFSYLPPHVHTTVMNAARIHLSLIKQIQRGERISNGVDYYEYLRKEQRALTLMAERFTIVEKRFKSLLPLINEELMKRDQQFEQQIHSIIQTQQLQNQLLAIIPDDVNAIAQIHEIIGVKDVDLNTMNSYADVTRISLNIHTVPDSMGQDPFAVFLSPSFDINQVTTSPLSKENFYSDPQQFDPNNL